MVVRLFDVRVNGDTLLCQIAVKTFLRVVEVFCQCVLSFSL